MRNRGIVGFWAGLAGLVMVLAPGNASAQSSTEQATSGNAQPPIEQANPADPPPLEPPRRWQVELFNDRERALEPLLADPLEARFHVGFSYDDEGVTYWDIGVGGELMVLTAILPGGGILTGGGRGLIAARFDFFSDSFDLLDAGYIGGGFVGYRWGANAAELLFFHHSAHLGDEILDRDERDRIDYSLEALRAMYGRDLGPARLYGGATWRLRADPEPLDRRFLLQAGAEVKMAKWPGVPFAALEVQARQEHAFSPELSIRAGVHLGSTQGRRQRIYLAFYNGYSRMGQFYNEEERYVEVGLAYP